MFHFAALAVLAFDQANVGARLSSKYGRHVGFFAKLRHKRELNHASLERPSNVNDDISQSVLIARFLSSPGPMTGLNEFACERDNELS